MRGCVFLPNPDLTLRSASSADAAILTAIHKDCFPNYWDHAAFTDFFSVPGTIALLVETLTESVGMGVFRIQHDQADILTIAVRPKWQRQGIGRLLLERAMTAAAANGAKAMFLDVEEGNAAAWSLYTAYGFVQINRRKQYYKQKNGSYTDALVMRGKLA